MVFTKKKPQEPKEPQQPKTSPQDLARDNEILIDTSNDPKIGE